VRSEVTLTKSAFDVDNDATVPLSTVFSRFRSLIVCNRPSSFLFNIYLTSSAVDTLVFDAIASRMRLSSSASINSSCFNLGGIFRNIYVLLIKYFFRAVGHLNMRLEILYLGFISILLIRYFLEYRINIIQNSF